MHRRMGGALLAFTLMLGFAPASRARQAEGRFVLFVASREGGRGEFQVEPLAFIDGRGAFGETGDPANEAVPSFSARYYKPGARYRFLYGGADAGSLTIRDASAGECAPSSARAAVTTSARLGRDASALATDATLKLRAQSSRRAPNAAERAGALRLAKSIFKQERVNAAAVNARTTALDLTATDLDGDGHEELVGSYLVRTGPKVRDVLFLVAAPKGSGYDAAFRKHERINAREMMDASAIGEVGKGGFLSETFIDQFDADGDGVAEFFTAAGSFEGTTYRAYRREGATWRSVYEHYSYRCAY